MGHSQSSADKNEANAQAQVINNVTQVETKLNYVTIVLIVIACAFLIIIIYTLRRQCLKKTQSWLRKELNKAGGPAPLQRVQVQPAPQHPTY